MRMLDAKRKALAVVVLQALLPSAEATTYTVNSALDPLTGSAQNCAAWNPGSCSLRDAIAAASDGDTVAFLSDTTISMVSGHALEVNHDITIAAQGHHVVMDGNLAMGPILIIDAAATVSIDGLTARNAYGFNTSGGAVANHGTLTLANATLVDNRAAYGGGIYNAGTLTISRSTIANNSCGGGGGGIGNSRYGIAKVIESTISGNHSAWGGGINNLAGNISVVNSTIYGNQAFAGGGVRNWGGTVTITSSTLSGNTAAGVGCGTDSPDVCTHYGSTTFANTIIAGGCGGSAHTDHGGNFDSGASCGFNGPASRSNANLDLGTLHDNGGPTLTVLPGPTSDALDAGIDAVCTAPAVNAVDQRGVHRPQGPHCDSGAVESVVEQIFADNFGS
jgi:hypothetical protein